MGRGPEKPHHPRGVGQPGIRGLPRAFPEQLPRVRVSIGLYGRLPYLPGDRLMSKAGIRIGTKMEMNDIKMFLHWKENVV